MVVDEFWVLLLDIKNEKAGIRLEKIYAGKKRQNLVEIDGVILQSKGMVKKILGR